MQLEGKIYRELENRRTQRITLGKEAYFIKQHFGVGWKETFKNLSQLKFPVWSAKNEWLAIQKLQKLNIPTLDIVAFGSQGFNPIKRQSFLITRELPRFITLEELGLQWKKVPPSFQFKCQLLKEVARISRILHTHGMNHRDFYLCHFLLSLDEVERGFLKLFLIDLHRAQIRHRTPKRWIIKDLAGLYFSSRDIGLKERDIWRFIKWYRGKTLHEIVNKEKSFWWKVKNRGDKLYQSQKKIKP